MAIKAAISIKASPATINRCNNLPAYTKYGDPATAVMAPGALYFLKSHHGLYNPNIGGHPALILSLDFAADTAEVLLISSLGGKTILEYTTNPRVAMALWIGVTGDVGGVVASAGESFKLPGDGRVPPFAGFSDDDPE
ncbi:MAG: hypothetical protein Q9174_004726 [Haloplaca sp. 1 TL-2023]